MFSMIPASMPTISPRRDIRLSFTNARRLSAGAKGHRWVVIIDADGTLINVPVPTSKEADRSLLHHARKLLAPNGEPVTGLAITAINCTEGAKAGASSFHKILPLIPNLSYLVGVACLGNTVVVYEGHANDFLVGCTDTDVLLVDDGMIPLLRPDWVHLALETLRQPRIYLFGRDGQMRKVDRVTPMEAQPNPSVP